MNSLFGGTFYGCSSLTKILIPSNIEGINDGGGCYVCNDNGLHYGAFENSGLEEITLEEGIQYIG